jgi:hypothetical protein
LTKLIIYIKRYSSNKLGDSYVNGKNRYYYVMGNNYLNINTYILLIYKMEYNE